MNNNILVCFRGRLDSDLRSSFASRILKTKRKCESYFCIDANLDKKTKYIVGLFKFNKIINLKNKKNYLNIFFVIKVTFLFIKSLLCLIFFKKRWLVNNFGFAGILLGDLVYDQYARFYFDFKKNFLSIRLFILIFNTLDKALLIKNLLIKRKIKYLIVSSYSYATLSSIAIRIATKMNIKVIIIGGNYFKIFNNYSDALDGYYKISRNRINDFKAKNTNISSALKYFEMRLNGDSFIKDKKDETLNFNELDAKRAYFQKREVDKSQFLKEYSLKNDKPIFVIATHCFKDANHLYGRFLFDDFFDETNFLLKNIKNNTSFHWFVKAHPMSDYYGEENIVKNIISDLKTNNIKLIDNDISTKSILNIADRIFTSRGTIAIEFAGVGKKPYISSKSYFSDLDFCHLITSKKELLASLNDTQNNNHLNENQKIDAKCCLYLRKEEILRKNRYNLTEPIRHITYENFTQQLKLNLYNKKNLEGIKKNYTNMLNNF